MTQRKARGPPSRSWIVCRIDYVKDLATCEGSLRYIAFRPRPGEEPQLFGRTTDHADLKAFLKRLDDPLTRDPRAPKMHRVIFSMREKDWHRCGIDNWRGVIRQALAEMEAKHGRRLEWVASEHPEPGHRHVHVHIKSVWTDSRGRSRRLVSTREQGQQLRLDLKEAVERQMLRARELALQQERQQWRAQAMVYRFANTAANALLQLIKRLKHRLTDEERRREIARQRQMLDALRDRRWDYEPER